MTSDAPRVGYVMSRTEQGVLTPAMPPSSSLELLAENVTDLKRPQYEGPIPEPGQTVRGVVLGHSYQKGVVGPPDVSLTVWVRALRLTERNGQ